MAIPKECLRDIERLQEDTKWWQYCYLSDTTGVKFEWWKAFFQHDCGYEKDLHYPHELSRGWVEKDRATRVLFALGRSRDPHHLATTGSLGVPVPMIFD